MKSASYIIKPEAPEISYPKYVINAVTSGTSTYPDHLTQLTNFSIIIFYNNEGLLNSTAVQLLVKYFLKYSALL